MRQWGRMGQNILTLQINELEGGVETSATEAERAFVSPDGVSRDDQGRAFHLRQNSSTSTAWTSRGPCTPRIRICSMSAVRLVPVTNTAERPEFKPGESLSRTSSRDSTT